jgi:hypothetical protein
MLTFELPIYQLEDVPLENSFRKYYLEFCQLETKRQRKRAEKGINYSCSDVDCDKLSRLKKDS